MSNDKQLESDDQQTSLGGGRNITFSPGNGKPSGNIIFIADGREMMRFDHDGKVYVRGEQVDDNQGIYMHFRRWLALAFIIPPDKD